MSRETLLHWCDFSTLSYNLCKPIDDHKTGYDLNTMNTALLFQYVCLQKCVWIFLPMIVFNKICIFTFWYLRAWFWDLFHGPDPRPKYAHQHTHTQLLDQSHLSFLHRFQKKLHMWNEALDQVHLICKCTNITL